MRARRGSKIGVKWGRDGGDMGARWGEMGAEMGARWVRDVGVRCGCEMEGPDGGEMGVGWWMIHQKHTALSDSRLAIRK